MLKNLLNILKAWLRIGGEAVIDSQRVVLMEQGIVNAQEQIKKSETALVALKAERKIEEKNASDLEQKIAEYTKHLQALAEKGEGQGDLARKIATEYANVQNDLTKIKSTISTQAVAEDKILKEIQTARDIVRDAERRSHAVKANESLIQAKAAVSSSTSGISSEIANASDHLKKLEASQAQQLARLDAASDYEDQRTGRSFDRELEAAGLTSTGVNADDILSQFNKKEPAQA